MASMFDIGGLGGTAINWMMTTAFWIFLMVVLVIGFFGILIFRKRRKFSKIVLEMFDLGDGRFDYRLTKGGFFKSKFTLFGLWDYGIEDRFRLKDHSPVDNVSHNDYRYFNGKQCITVIRNPNDPKVIMPISKFYLTKETQEMMADVAPADFRDSAVKAIEQTDQEMMTKWEKYAPLVIIGVVVIISLVITLLNTQYGKYMVDKATEAILEIRQTPCGAAASNAP